MLNIDVRDQNCRVTEEELSQAVSAAAPVLARAQAGEEKYRDSLGWLNLDRWAGDQWLDRIEAIAENVKKTCDAFVIIGVGGSNNAARSVIEALECENGVRIVYAGNTLSPAALNKMLRSLEGAGRFLPLKLENTRYDMTVTALSGGLLCMVGCAIGIFLSWSF